jgi:hypothetical protein
MIKEQMMFYAWLLNDKRYQTGVIAKGKLNDVFYITEEELNSIDVFIKDFIRGLDELE